MLQITIAYSQKINTSEKKIICLMEILLRKVSFPAIYKH